MRNGDGQGDSFLKRHKAAGPNGKSNFFFNDDGVVLTSKIKNSWGQYGRRKSFLITDVN